VLDDGIRGSGGVDFHDILKTGASTFFDSEAESFPGTFGGNQVEQGNSGLVRESDHALFL
jgi:hypothetical protein